MGVHDTKEGKVRLYDADYMIMKPYFGGLFIVYSISVDYETLLDINMIRNTQYLYSSPSLIRPPYLPRNVAILERWPLVRGRSKYIDSSRVVVTKIRGLIEGGLC